MNTHKLIYLITNFPQNVYRETKYFIQRGRRGYCDRDCWCIYSHLCEILPGMLRTMRDGVSYPTAMTEDKWRKTLDIIIEGFDAGRDMDYFNDKEEYDKLKIKLDKGLELFSRHFLSLWD